MDAALRKQGLTLVVVGALFMPIAPVAGGLIASATIRQSASFATSMGGAIFLVGCIFIARAKGQPWYVGLLGFLNCLGLAILWFLVPDKSK